jgi:hypothetical protein
LYTKATQLIKTVNSGGATLPKKSLELYLETLKLKKEIEESNKFKEIIRNFVSIKS